MLDVLMSVKDAEGGPRFSADEITGMFISMMFAGHHTSSGTAAWTLIELLRHPDVLAGVVAELDRALRRRFDGQFPGAAGDSAAGVGGQGGAAPASAVDPVAAGRERRIRGAGLHDQARRLRWRHAGDLQPDTGGLPGTGLLRPGPLCRAAPGGPGQPLDVDPVRRRAAPLRRRGVRHDAAEGHLLGAAAGLHVRAGAAVGRPIATTTRRWSCSWRSRAVCGTAGGCP